MPAASILVKPSSANCNIDCKYCFYKCLSSNRAEYSKGFMSDKTLECLIKRGFEYADDYISFAFQGGEPTIAGIEFFKKAVLYQHMYNREHIQIENTIQTNGMLLDEEWARFLADNHFLVGLSLDGPRKVHDIYRRDINGTGTFERVMETVALFDRYHVQYNILSVVSNDSVSKAGTIYRFFKRHKFAYLQFIPCMGDENIAVNPVKYGKFLCELFDLWIDDFHKGGQTDIRMFSNLAQMAAGYPPEECGMCGHCNCYLVVEGDGSVYPCDFYCTDEWQLGTVEDSFDNIVKSHSAQEFVERSHNVPEGCIACKYYAMCRGGCYRWRDNMGGKCSDTNYLCEGYILFFEHVESRIKELGQYILEKYDVGF